MQSTSAASRRAFSFLASKIHPQLPLSPRESQQLLNLLTTSFRAHLDRAHPVPAPQSREPASRKALVLHVPQHAQSRTSQASASNHIDSILTNPLFSAPSRRRGSDAATDVNTILKDPLGWFLDQAAIGAADIPKASACLAALTSLDRRLAQAESRPGSQIASWLWSSGSETSKAFIGQPYLILPNLVPLLVKRECNEAPIWRWLGYEDGFLAEKTGLALKQVREFKARLLKLVVQHKMEREGSMDEALIAFLRFQNLPQGAETTMTLRPAGSLIIKHLFANPEASVSPELYHEFLSTVRQWAGSFHRVLESLLWLQHPTKPSARPGLAYIQHLNEVDSLATERPKRARAELLVQLCLGVARHLLAEQSFADAQVALEFAKVNFPDILSPELGASPTSFHGWAEEPGSKPEKPEWRRRKEEEKNLRLLDSLVPS